jgi:ketosteroid isomerase-like protein
MAQDLKSTGTRALQIAAKGDLSEFDQLFDKDVYYHATSGEEARGLDQLKELVSGYRSAFSNLAFDVEDTVCEGDKVIAIYRQRGKHTGPLLEMEPSQKDLDLPVCSVTTFKNGKISEIHEIFDTLDLMRQLGALPEEMAPPPRREERPRAQA